MAAERPRRPGLSGVWALPGPDGLAARFVKGVLEDLLVAADPAGGLEPGEIHRARVGRLIDGGEGPGRSAILAGADGAALFLSDAGDLTSGETVIVQVTRAADGAKAARAERRLTLPGRWMVHTPGAPGVNVSRKIEDAAERERLAAAARPHAALGGFVVRTRAHGVADAELAAEAAGLAALAAQIETTAARASDGALLRSSPEPATRAAELWGERPNDLTGEPGVAERLLDAFDGLAGATVPLAEAPGAWMAVTPTPALVAVDVNAGAGVSARAATLAALRALPRQLRLRGLGGVVAIDCAAPKKKDHARFQAALAQSADPALRVLGFGPAGLLEAIRTHDRPPLSPRLDVARALVEKVAAKGDATAPA